MQTLDGASTMSTSIFMLTGLGLASGYCASEALRQIESVASRPARTPDRKRGSPGYLAFRCIR
jgi:hypothetical protein